MLLSLIPSPSSLVAMCLAMVVRVREILLHASRSEEITPCTRVLHVVTAEDDVERRSHLGLDGCKLQRLWGN